jgi:conjugative relaxase-like TrwC/TraI family protein
MLSVGVVSAGGMRYYFDTVAGGVDDYYVRTEPGRWLGGGATRLGFEGDVDQTRLRQFIEAGQTAGGNGPRVDALDLTFSAPKSVSLLAEIGDDTHHQKVLAAHHHAVNQALGLLEVEAARGRRGHGGTRTVTVDGVVAAGFDHHTSRSGDPQLHTHVLVANRALGSDGQWGALDSRRMFGWAKTAGYAYQAALRHELAATLGLTWTPVTNGTAEIAGIPQRVLEAFSTRRAQIVAALDTYGGSSPRAAQTAALATRPAKPATIEPGVQRQVWQDRAAAIGCNRPDLAAVVGPGREVADVDTTKLAARLVGPAGLTARRSSFDLRAVIEAVCAAAPDGIDATRLAVLAGEVLADPGFTPTGSPGRLAGPTWTTVELVDVETRLLQNVARRRDEIAAVCATVHVDRAIEARPGLAAEQKMMVRTLCGGGAGVDVVVGPAGTGKTYALDAARDAWTRADIPVIGTALAARTARALETGTGIPSATLDQLLADLDRPGPHTRHVLTYRGVLVVDEAGMVGTRKLGRLLAAAETSNTKVVLVGDPRQLPEIEAGGALAALTQQHPPIVLSENRRQTDEWERAALADLRDGKPGLAVTALGDHGRIVLAPTAETARHHLVADWAVAHTADGPGRPTVMVAMTRTDVDDLNTRAIAHLEHLGHLDPDRPRLHAGGDPSLAILAGTVGAATNQGGTVFGVGERVMALRNDRRIGIVNGTTATITDINAADRSLVVQPDTPGTGPVVVPASYLDDGRLTHGWAITIHKAQGSTVDRAFLLGTDRLYREAGYVALSRATTRTDWYHVSPDTPAYAPLQTSHGELTRLLSRSAAQHLATPTDTDLLTRRAAVLADPGPHLTHALGPPPLTRPERQKWAATALTVDDYRTRHHITSPDPLGPRPPAGQRDQARDWDHAQVALTQTRRDLGVDIDHTLGLGR